MGIAQRCVLASLVGLSLVGLSLAQAGRTQGEGLLDQFLRLDANGDGSVGRDEVTDSARPAFDRLLERGDRDRDGKFDAKEYQAVVGGLRAFEEDLWKKAIDLFDAMDKDRDHRVSRHEYAGPRSRFDELDRDADGYLTPQELVAAAQVKAAPESGTSNPGREQAAGVKNGG
jgi:Ca2+-binding EF-hand superfamily protein